MNLMLAKLAYAKTGLHVWMKAKITLVFALQASKEIIAMKISSTAKRTHAHPLLRVSIYQEGSIVNVHSTLLVMIAEKVSRTIFVMFLVKQNSIHTLSALCIIY
jgi:hypothetical protein